jgi:hypothetical protein
MLNRTSDAQSHQPQRDGRSSIEEARRFRSRATRSGRWFAGYLVALGLLSAVWITLIETTFSDPLPRLGISAVWAVAWIGAAWWAERRSVYPVGASRSLWVSFATWFGLYLFVIGPIVRGAHGDAIVPWAIGSAVMAMPFLIAAVLVLRRR